MSERTIEIRFPLEIIEAAIKEAFARNAYGSLNGVLTSQLQQVTEHGLRHALQPIAARAVQSLLADETLAAEVRAALRSGFVEGAREAGKAAGKKASAPAAQMLLASADGADR